jgi:hypothetical protein
MHLTLAEQHTVEQDEKQEGAQYLAQLKTQKRDLSKRRSICRICSFGDEQKKKTPLRRTRSWIDVKTQYPTL